MNAEVNSKKIRKFAAMAIAILVLIYVVIDLCFVENDYIFVFVKDGLAVGFEYFYCRVDYE